MKRKFVYIVNVENVWYNQGERNNRDCKNYKVFDQESKATDFMLKVWKKAKKLKQARFKTEVDAIGMVSAEVFFNAGFDAIANTETFTTIIVNRVAINNSAVGDVFQEIMNDIYIG